MANFDNIFTKLIKVEGGYVNDPDDAGGETYAGVSRKYNKYWSGWTIIDNYKKNYKTTKELNNVLAKDSALQASIKKLYKENYWDVLELDLIPSDRIASQMFDTCVNMGKVAAIQFAQKALNVPITGKMSTDLINKLSKIKNETNFA